MIHPRDHQLRQYQIIEDISDDEKDEHKGENKSN